METKFLKDSLGWGVVLWLIGYVLGIVLFMAVPANMIGWVIMPIGILITLWVSLRLRSGQVIGAQGQDMVYYLKVAVVWTAIAIVFDYFFLVLLFKPAGGYYKLDVYFYYVTTFVLPLLVGYFKTKDQRPAY